MPSWPPLENLQALLRSSRYFFLWHGTRSQSYTEPSPGPPNTHSRKRCHCVNAGLVWTSHLHYRTFQLKHVHGCAGIPRTPTLSLMSRAMSKCLWQQTTASSNRPSTFNVLPRFPLALASPSRSPIVLSNTHHVSNNKLVREPPRTLCRPNLVRVRSCRWNSRAFV